MTYSENKIALELGNKVSNDQQSDEVQLSESEKKYILNFRQVKQLENEALETLYSDIIELECEYKFRKTLGDSIYDSSNKYAQQCLSITINCRDKFDYFKVPIWTEHALQSLSLLLLNYVNNILKEEIPQYNKQFTNSQKDVYIYLKNKGDQYYVIGDSFISVYRTRSEFAHPYQRNIDGKIVPVKMKNPILEKKHKNNVENLKKGLMPLLEIYKKDLKAEES